MGDISLHLRRNTCKHRDISDCQAQHPHIEACAASIWLSSDPSIVGHIYLNILQQAAMNLIGPVRMWDECNAYDESHLGAKLDKVENYLANESFTSQRDTQTKNASHILFVEECVLNPNMRGKGRGLVAVKKVIEELQLPSDTLVLLQAGPIGNTGNGRLDAGERIAGHWKKLGFAEWSESDESWLCLLLEEMEGRPAELQRPKQSWGQHWKWKYVGA